ncbi:MAG: AbrB/MazE/SpoVT family DNA-binding domain-containing protein [Steroidobacteraceae bacterium]
MRALQIPIRRIGNSRGVVIPKPLLSQAGLEEVVDVTVEGEAIILRKPRGSRRDGWAEAARELAKKGGDVLVMGEFGNEADADLTW